jgi:hypothetical protein
VGVVSHLVWLGILLAVFSAGIGESTIPSEVRYKSGYVNPVLKPQEFTSAML